jgi:hypothetical protein
MSEPRTKAAALEVLLNLLPEAVREIDDPKIRALLTADLVREVFEQAWKHQFEDDRGTFQRHIKDIALEAVERLGPGAASQ